MDAQSLLSLSCSTKVSWNGLYSSVDFAEINVVVQKIMPTPLDATTNVRLQCLLVSMYETLCKHRMFLFTFIIVFALTFAQSLNNAHLCVSRFYVTPVFLF